MTVKGRGEIAVCWATFAGAGVAEKSEAEKITG